MLVVSHIACFILGAILGMSIMYFNLSGYVSKELDDLM